MLSRCHALISDWKGLAADGVVSILSVGRTEQPADNQSAYYTCKADGTTISAAENPTSEPQMVTLKVSATDSIAMLGTEPARLLCCRWAGIHR